MRKLLRSHFARVLCSKIFWTGLLFQAGTAVLLMTDTFRRASAFELMGGNGHSAEGGYAMADVFQQTMFHSVVFMGIVFAVFSSVFLGTEYSDGTIRNKIAAGHSRLNIYLAGFFTCTAAGMVQAAAGVATELVTGFLLMGKPKMQAGQTVQIIIVMLFICMAYAALFTMAAMLLGSRTHAAVVNILLAAGMLFLAVFLSAKLQEPEMITNYVYMTGDKIVQAGNEMPNPNYVSGIRRVIYQLLMDVLPGGQNYVMTNSAYQGILRYPALLCIYSAAVTVISGAAGIFVFLRKDIK